MKKNLLATLLALSVGVASAATVVIDGENSDPKVGSDNSRQLQLTVKAPINTLLTGDIGIASQITDNTYKQTARYEAGVTAQTAVFGPVDGYARGAIGQKSVSSADGYGYYSAEAGVVYHTPVAGLDAKVGYRYRNSFDDAQESKEKTNTFRYAVSYKLSKEDQVGVRYDRVNGAGANSAVGVFYARSF